MRDQGNFNVPRPNGFFFPSAGKRSSGYNIPRPNGFFFPSATGKRGLMRFFPKSTSFFPINKEQLMHALKRQMGVNRRSQNWQNLLAASQKWSQPRPRLIKRPRPMKPRLL